MRKYPAAREAIRGFNASASLKLKHRLFEAGARFVAIRGFNASASLKQVVVQGLHALFDFYPRL